MNRLHHLKQTLLRNITDNSDYGHLKIFRKGILSVLIAITLPALAQEVNINQIDETYLPEDYVKSILATHQRKTPEMFRKQPLEAVLIINGDLYIKTYGGKLVAVLNKKDQNEEIALQPINGLLNLKYYRADDFKHTGFRIKKENQYLSVNTIEDSTRKTIPFISSINGYAFENPEVSYTKLLLNGSYLLMGNGKKSAITFDLKGNISDNGDWAKYIIDRVYLYSKHKKGAFQSITLISKNGNKRLNLAFTYHSATKSWEGFNYQEVIGNEIDIHGKAIELIRK